MYANLKRTLAMTLAAAMVFAMASGCKKNDPGQDESGDSSPASSEGKDSSEVENPLTPPKKDSAYQVTIPKENKDKMKETKGKAKDTIAWLQIPGTKVDEAVVQTKDNEFYYRRDIYGTYQGEAGEGCLYVDFECNLGKGTKSDMPQNTIIYGHNLGNPLGQTDDANGVKFAQLLHFSDIEFAKKTPYVYLTTEGEDLVYEVFAVSYTEDKSKPIEYILPKYSAGDFQKLVADFQSRSIYKYPDVKVTATDKVLTLSTCTYKYGAYRENNKQRFVVMARLVTDKNFVEKAKVEANPSPKQPTFAK